MHRTWRGPGRAVIVVLAMALVIVSLPGRALGDVSGLYMNTNAKYNKRYLDFGSQRLTGGKANTVGSEWTPWIYTLYGSNLSVYASAKGSGRTAELRHGASNGKRSACKWTYTYPGGSGNWTQLKCVYYAPSF